LAEPTDVDARTVYVVRELYVSMYYCSSKIVICL